VSVNSGGGMVVRRGGTAFHTSTVDIGCGGGTTDTFMVSVRRTTTIPANKLTPINILITYHRTTTNTQTNNPWRNNAMRGWLE